MINHAILCGRLTKNPELRKTADNKSIASFSIAVNRDYKDSSGNKATDFFDCVCWDGKADFVNKYVKKGMLVVVDGRLQTNRWKDKNDITRVSYDVVIDNIQLADSSHNSDNNTSYTASYNQKPSTSQSVLRDDDEEDTPF